MSLKIFVDTFSFALKVSENDKKHFLTLSGAQLGLIQDGCEIWDANSQILNILQIFF